MVKCDDEDNIDINQLLCSVPLLVFSMFVFFLIQNIDQWKCCPSFLQPVTERTLHSIKNPEKVIYLKEHHELEEIEMANQTDELELDKESEDSKKVKKSKQKQLKRQVTGSVFDDLPF